MNQGESVFQAIVSVCGQPTQGEAVKLSAEQRKQVNQIVTESILSGETQMTEKSRAKYDSHEKMVGYVSGLISNWLRKDLRLNGGTPYKPTKTGRRGDAILKELHKVLNLVETDEHRETVLEAIEARKAEIAEEKKSKVEINTDILPEAVRHLAS